MATVSLSAVIPAHAGIHTASRTSVPCPGFVYVLASKPNGTLYVGVTSDLVQRVGEHRENTTPGFTSEYGVHRLVWFERHEDIQNAIRREKQVKTWRRAWRLDLVRSSNPQWTDLWDDVSAVGGEIMGMPDRRTDSCLRGNDEVEAGAGYRSSLSESWSGPARTAVTVLLTALLLAACGPQDPGDVLAAGGPPALAALAVEVNAPAEDDTLDAARATFQTDQAGAAWYDALAAPGDDPAMGLTADGERVLDGWTWWSERDSVTLGPADRLRGVARPDFAVRHYLETDTSGVLTRILARVQGATRARLAERVTLLGGSADGQATLLVEVPDSVGTVGFRPVRSDRPAAGDYRIEQRDGTLLIARGDRVVPDSLEQPTEGVIWTAVRSDAGAVTLSKRPVTPEGGRRAAFALGELAMPTPGRLVIATGPTADAADAAARVALQNAEARVERRQRRQVALLQRAAFDTDDDTYDAAFRWALLSLDALTGMTTDSTGTRRVTLEPGLPGAAPASYPSAMWTMGAWLGSGQWETARGMLTTAGRAQRFDRRFDVLGRAPDLVPARGEPVFATADGTPLFLAAAGDYVRQTGDRSLVRGAPDFWFKSVFATRGFFEDDPRNGSVTDSTGLLVARERRGTWADSDRELGGFVRRGAPAEGQAALVASLRATRDFAAFMAPSQRGFYADTADAFERTFQRRFVRGDLVADRAGSTGPAPDVRPGGLLALTLLDGFPERDVLARRLAERLVFPYGVASLAQSDSAFHPYLRVPGVYAPEAARTSGAVWTWLAGPVATLMAEGGGTDPAYDLMAAQAGILLDRGVVGALPELLDGHPRDDGLEPGLGGAPVQPWSLAGLVSATYEGFLGAERADGDTLVLQPRLPDAWGEARTRLRVGQGFVTATIRGDGETARVEVTPGDSLGRGATLRLVAGGRRVSVPLVSTQGDSLVTPRETFTLEVSAAGAELDGAEVPSAVGPEAGTAWDDFAFAPVTIPERYAVLRTVAEQRNLSGEQLLQRNPFADVILTQTDPDGDDFGATGTFTYPDAFPGGVLDATFLELTRDDTTMYVHAEFRAVLDRDSLGRPPAMVAILFDTEEGGKETVDLGARYDMPDGGGYEYAIFASDGVRIEDAKGRTLGELAAGGESPFDADLGTLDLAVPQFVIPRLSRRDRVTLLVGARDDGGGLGEFEAVQRDAGERYGGGRVDTSSPNVYDVIVGTVR